MKYADTYEEFQRVKAVFNTRNPVGDMLFKLSEQMVASGMLEKNDEPSIDGKAHSQAIGIPNNEGEKLDGISPGGTYFHIESILDALRWLR